MASKRPFPKSMYGAAATVLRQLHGANLIPQGSGAGVYPSHRSDDGSSRRTISVYVGRNTQPIGADPWADVLDALPWTCRIDRDDHSNGTVFKIRPAE